MGCVRTNTDLKFEIFLEWCVDQVGGQAERAKGHFRNAGWTIAEHCRE
jgi:hypothetical protein